jgi:methionyl-tRNA formyltransferase
MTDDFRVVFMGTPEFAVASLKALSEAGVNIVGVVTTPDKPQGRGQVNKESDIKKFARSINIPILEPEKLKNEVFINDLRRLNADLNVVVAFRMLPEVVWSMPSYGTINLHASLLPNYRGAAPINWAIINGETKTGVTTFIIDKEIDTGKILFSEEVDILPEDNAGSLHDKLMIKGSELLVRTVLAIRNHDYKPSDQLINLSDEPLKFAPKIVKETCRIDWDNDINKVHNFIRGLSPYPGAWTFLRKAGCKEQFSIKIYETQKEFVDHDFPFGNIVTDEKKFLKIAVRGGYLHLITVQAEGRKRLHIEDFLRGIKNSDQLTVNC